MKLPYYPGCSLKTVANNFETPALSATQALGVELIELPRWNCCGAVYSLSHDDLMHQIAPIRNLIRVQEMHKEGIVDENRLVTLCAMCYNTLKRTNILVKNNPEKLNKLNEAMDREEAYRGEVKVIHYLELLKEIGFSKVSEKVTRPLNGLKVSPYYGCLLLRPNEVGIDDPEHPTIFEELLGALDAEVVDNPFKMQCCGSYHTVERKDLVIELAHKNLNYAMMNGAEALALCCPLCAFNLDNRQPQIQKMDPTFSKIPVFYVTQLIAIAFGLNLETLALHLNYVDPTPLLQQRILEIHDR